MDIQDLSGAVSTSGQGVYLCVFVCVLLCLEGRKGVELNFSCWGLVQRFECGVSGSIEVAQ